MIVGINYANHKFKWARIFSKVASVKLGRLDHFFSYTPDVIDEGFASTNQQILSNKRGAGYWLWKPYIISKVLSETQEGDWLVYIDAGGFLFKSIIPIIEKAEQIEQSVVGFELPLIEKQWTKTEVLSHFAVNKDLMESNQLMATMVLIKNDIQGRCFVKDWLTACCNYELISDETFYPQSNSFLEHRHDQSLFSVLYKKNLFVPFADITQRRTLSKSYSKCCHENIIEKDVLYSLNDGRLFRFNSCNISTNTTYVFLHKTNKPIYMLIKSLLKLIIGYNRKYSLK